MIIKHPAKYSPELLPHLARYVDGALTILDPFAGTGRIGLIKAHLTTPAGICVSEIEAEWAAQCWSNGCDDVWVRDARHLPFSDGRFDAIVTSPAYGNRMADACDWAPGRKHSTYTSALRETTGDPTRDLSPGNAGGMQWGDPYRRLHREAWAEAWRVLVPGGRLVLNIADHYREGQLQGVPEWHVSALLALGFVLLDWVEVGTQRYGFGANSELRAPELVICLAKPGRGPTWRTWFAPPHRDGPLWDVQAEPQQLTIF